MNILERLGLVPSSIVLDLGFRDPNELVLISNLAGEIGLVYGIEPDQSLIAKTIEKVNHIKNVRPMVGDASKVPLSDESVDVVIFKGVLHEVRNPLRALNEAGRVCREGGKILIVDFSAFPARWLLWSNLRWRLRHPGRIFARSLDKHPGFSGDAIRAYVKSSGLVLERFEPSFAVGHNAGHSVPMFLASARK